MLDQVATPHYGAAVRAPTGARAAREVRVGEDHELAYGRLPSEALHEPGDLEHVPGEAPECNEVALPRHRHAPAQLFGREGEIEPVLGQVVRAGRCPSEPPSLDLRQDTVDLTSSDLILLPLVVAVLRLGHGR